MNLVIEDLSKPVVFRGVLDKDIFTWEDVTRLLNIKIYNWIEIIQNSIKIEIPSVYAGWEELHFDRKFINNKINEGAGIVLTRLSSYNEALNGISRGIEESFDRSYFIENKITSWSVDAHCYCGLQNGKESFNIHADRTANFIAQLDGVCDWTVYKERYNPKIDASSDENLTKEIETTLSPGDVLYIPHDTYHHCRPQTKRLSLSFAAEPDSKNEPVSRTYYKYG